MALARLVARAGDDALTSTVIAALQPALAPLLRLGLMADRASTAALAGLRAFLPPSVRAVVPADFLAALLAASQNVEIVQQGAIVAAGRFRRLSADFQAEAALAHFAAALNGESGAAAYLAARLLGALGSSPAAAELPGLRQRFAHLLSEAWSQPQAREPVWGDREAGSRGQAILAALLQVWGQPGGYGQGDGVRSS